MEFVFIVILTALFFFGLYTLGFILPKQLKDITSQLEIISKQLEILIDLNKKE